jgi:hypothetical protein
MQSYVSDQIKTLNNGIIYNSIHWPMKWGIMHLGVKKQCFLINETLNSGIKH